MSSPLRQQLQVIAQKFTHELAVYRHVLRDHRTPRLAKILLGLAVAYALLPFDLIPDFLPIIGHLDDMIIVPGLVFLALRFIPPEVLAECRQRVIALASEG